MAIITAISIIMACFATYILTRLYIGYALKHSILDIPDSRSSHQKPKPRGGGVSFVIVAVIFYAIVPYGFMGNSEMFVMLIGASILAVTGFIDDLYNLKAIVRFAIQALVSIIFLVSLGGWPELNLGLYTINWGLPGICFATLFLIWSTNLFNFMDGIDGIAGTEAIFVLTCGGLMIWHAGGQTEGMFVLVLAASVAGFLIWNRYPANIFMGDAGSYFLGFLISSIALIGEIRYGVSVLAWIILYGVFWFDATVTLLRRIARGENFISAHRSHAYQRLCQYGWSHGRVTSFVALANMPLALMAFIAYSRTDLALPMLLSSIVMLSIFYLLIERVKPM